MLKEYVRVIAKSAIPLIILWVAFTDKPLLNSSRKGVILCTSILAICSLAGIKLRDPLYYIEQQLPQIRFQNAISQIKDASILVYGTTDFGFIKQGYTYPQVKYFCNVNLRADDTISTQIDYIKNEMVDFIITPLDINELLAGTPLDINELLVGTSYQLIDTSECYVYVGHQYYFALYQKQPNHMN